MARDPAKEVNRHTSKQGYAKALRRIKQAARERTADLDLSALGLTALPPEIGQLTALTTLDISKNRLTALPPEIGQLNALTSLSVWNNQLDALSPEIGRLVALTTLDASFNRLNTLPPEIGQLTALIELSLLGNQLTALPPEIGRLTELRTLLISSNKLTAMPAEVGKLTALITLDAQHNLLTLLPPEIGQLVSLTNLRVARNQLKTLPPEIKQLVALKTLVLLGNPVAELPPELHELATLEFLDLDGCGLSQVPPVVSQLTTLTSLDLRNNQLTKLSPEIGQMTALTKLCVRRNQLTALPPEIGRLTALTMLDLGDNQLTALPAEVRNLTALTELRLFDNRLGALPYEMRQLRKLERLYLHGNPGLGLPEEMLGPTYSTVLTHGQQPKAPRQILNYYFLVCAEATLFGAPTTWRTPRRPAAAERPGARPRRPPGRRTKRPPPPQKANMVREARLIVIGDGESGKTSLVRALLDDKPARRSEKTTRDVLIRDWPRLTLHHPQTKRRHRVTVHVWDFGGQEPLHAAHPYFFTKRTLYLVVASSRQDGVERCISYWLKMVEAHGAGARALVAVNKVDQHPLDIKQRELCAAHPFCLSPNPADTFFPTSCRKGRMNGIAELRNAIRQELAQMNQIWSLVPAKWMAVKTALDQRRAQGEDTLTFEQWGEVCKECAIPERKRPEVLDLLRDFGTVVSFPDDDRLSSLGVLNPSWVTRAVYPLLTSTELAGAGGLLRQQDLGHLLRDKKRYPRHKHPWLIELMRKFELLFENDAQLLLPARLPKDAPLWADDPSWSTPGTLRLEIRFPVLPESVISKFIVRWNERALEPGKWWRHGVAVRDSTGNCAALVRAHLGAPGCIELRVQGPRTARQQFVGALRETIFDLSRNLGGDLWVVLEGVHPERYDNVLRYAHGGEPVIKRIVGSEMRMFDLVAALDLIAAPPEQKAALAQINFIGQDAHGNAFGPGSRVSTNDSSRSTNS